MADEYPSPEASNDHLADDMDMSSQLVNQAAAQAQAQALASSSTTKHGQEDHDRWIKAIEQEHHAASLIPAQNHLRPITTSAEQVRLFREFYARNPNPSRQDMAFLAERTGRPYIKVREYFRQRRNKMRGLEDLEDMEEPGRAAGWLKMTYRADEPESQVSQLSLYSGYKARFDPYSSTSPLLGGQELIELVCATFPGCDMSKAGDEYYLSGLKEKEGGEGDWEKTLKGVAEPVRAATWLLSNFQQSDDGARLAQTELYTSYVLRFSAPPPAEDSPAPEQSTATSLQQAEGQFDISNLDDHNQEPSTETPAPAPAVHRRLLNPKELITLTRMTFPKCEPIVDEAGNFVIKGLEKSDGVEKGWVNKSDRMFPFALMSEPRPSDPDHPFTSLLKRKLSSLQPAGSESEKKPRTHNPPRSLGQEDKELLDGLRRFKDSDLGKEVKDICVNQ